MFYIASVVTLMYMVMGTSQAMKAAWIEDCLSLIPPICFLVGSYIFRRKPTQHFPYGFHRAVSILYLCAALALFLMGAYLLIDAMIKLASIDRSSIGMKMFFGHDMWLGWWMILVLLWGAIPPVILGRVKIGYARILNDKILITDGKMNKADWMTAVAAMGGVLGIGYGLWWADALAAAVISFDILKDGWQQSKDAVTGLMNRAPTSVDGGYIDLPKQIQKTLSSFDWIEKVEVRLYEHGRIIFGEGFIHSTHNAPVTADQVREATKAVTDLDWRLQEFALTFAPYETQTQMQ